MTLVSYCTPEQVEHRLGIRDAKDRVEVELACSTASRQIERETGQKFWLDTNAVARTFYPDTPFVVSLRDDGIGSTSGLIVKVDSGLNGNFDTTLTINTDFLLYPTNAALMSPAEPWTQIRLTDVSMWFVSSYTRRPTVQITAKWGWPAVPDEIRLACLLQATQLFRSRESTFGAVAVGDSGIAAFAQGLDRQTRSLIAPYKKLAVSP